MLLVGFRSLSARLKILPSTSTRLTGRMASSQAGPGPSSLRNLRPPLRPEMKTLDKSAFKVEVPILAVKVKATDMNRFRSDPSIRR